MLDGEDKIVALAVEGQPSAFGSLYEHYQPQIYRFIFLKVGSKDEAEDLTHQVFLNAWTGIAKYKHRGFPFSSWLYQIARNQVVDHYRSKKDAISIEEMDPDTLKEQFGTEGLDTALELERVMKAVRTLKTEYQDVLILRFVEDMTIKDVASALGKTEGAVKLLQHRALKILKDTLGEESPEEPIIEDENGQP